MTENDLIFLQFEYSRNIGNGNVNDTSEDFNRVVLYSTEKNSKIDTEKNL